MITRIEDIRDYEVLVALESEYAARAARLEAQIREDLQALSDANDLVLRVQLAREAMDGVSIGLAGTP